MVAPAAVIDDDVTLLMTGGVVSEPGGVYWIERYGRMLEVAFSMLAK
jgi:hypothetical protein